MSGQGEGEEEEEEVCRDNRRTESSHYLRTPILTLSNFQILRYLT